MSACLRCLLKSKLEVGEPRESNLDPNPEKRERREKEEDPGVLLPFKRNGLCLPDKGVFSKCSGIPELPSFCRVMKGSTIRW